MTRADHVLRLLRQGSYSKHDLAQHVGRMMGRKAWSVAVIEGDIRTLRQSVNIHQDANLFTIINYHATTKQNKP
jgi:hypothetical protein